MLISLKLKEFKLLFIEINTPYGVFFSYVFSLDYMNGHSYNIDDEKEKN